MMEFSHRFAICITTKNRPDDLRVTLEKLLLLGLSGIELILIDDGSDVEIIDKNVAGKFSKLKFFRNEISKGLIVNRNLMASMASAEFIISLDDDSCFTSEPDFEYLAGVFDRWPHAIGLQLNNFESSFGEHPVSPDVGEMPVQMYTGFGHVLRRKEFLALSGYLEDLVHMAEEREFAQRAWIAGKCIVFAPGVCVEHRRTPVARSSLRNLHFTIRNTIIFNIKNLPLKSSLLKAIMCPIYFYLKSDSGFGGISVSVSAAISGWMWLLKNRDLCRRMSLHEYEAYSALPLRRPNN